MGEHKKYPSGAVLDVRIDYIGKTIDEIKRTQKDQWGAITSNSNSISGLKAIAWCMVPLLIALTGAFIKVALAK